MRGYAWFHLRLVGVCVALFLMLMLAALAVGANKPPIDPLQAFAEGCDAKPQPCWFGVMPGITTAAEMVELMSFAGKPRIGQFLIGEGFTFSFSLPPPWPYCRVRFNVIDEQVVRAELSICRQPTIRVGDLAVLWWGAKQVVSLPPYELVYGTASVNAEGWPMPYSPVSYIVLLSPQTDLYDYPWHGFVAQPRYCQLVPYFPRCRTMRQ